jgi:putative ABC transport system permease protein
MRFLDLVGLSISTFARHKLRTALTTLGVGFATFMLTASLSIWGGIRETYEREASRFDDLRVVEVRPRWAGDPSAGKVEVRGRMSEERRERLRGELKRRREQQRPAPNVPITPARLKELADLDHVLAVRPLVFLSGRAFLGERSSHAACFAVPPDDRHAAERLLAGRTFSSAGGREALVTEYLLYEMGIIDDSAVEGVVGRRLRLEFRSGGRPEPALLLALRGRRAKVSPAEEKLLERVIDRLPEAVAKLDLKPAERKALARLLKRPDPRPSAPREVVLTEEVMVCGVLRCATDEETRRRHGWMYGNASVLLPSRTGEDLLLRAQPAGSAPPGFDNVLLEVDDVDNVKQVDAEVRGLGLASFAALVMIEREQFTYLLIFGALAVLSVIALVVAGLGLMNVMLMSVLERVREIGIMKAVGARDRHLLAVFLSEGAVVGLVGGLCGLLLTWGVSYPADAWLSGLINRRMGVKLTGSLFAFPWWLMLGAPLFATLVTVLAALFPAYRAVRVEPVTALRHE